ncbi:uncharacterized protein M6B38_194660 [Iris pallida]|uniref:Late embryogenesis abundant protein LEA-2 subgroup domain-containing protein n=1 Tax=Iris pallida TaxID=29817 RepID=A0AAX6EEC6_IRIPA|nr:uncharacterized protein M6B38_194660 [Iris pallida]
MAERIYPSAKPNPHPPTSAANGLGASAAAAPSFPATKAQAYGRPIHRPPPATKQQRRRRRSGRGCCCSCCLWLTLILIAAVLLAAIAGGVFYVLYRPRRPTFTVSSLCLSQLNLTSPANLLASRLDLSVTARNPNREVEFAYDPVSVSVSSDSGVHLGDGSFPPFLHGAKNTTVLRTSVSSSGESVDSSAVSDLKKKSTIPVVIELDTRAGVKVGKLKTKKIGIRVRCEGVSVPVPKNKKGAAAAAATTPDVSCKVKLRIKIWKWTI